MDLHQMWQGSGTREARYSIEILRAAMSELRPLMELVLEWRKRVDVLKDERNVAIEMDDWANELEAQLRAWDKHLKLAEGKERTWIGEHVLGISPK